MTFANTPLPSAGQVTAELEELRQELAQIYPDLYAAHRAYKATKKATKVDEAAIRLDQTGTVQERDDKTVIEFSKTEAYKQLCHDEIEYEALKLEVDGRLAQASICQSELKYLNDEREPAHTPTAETYGGLG